MIFFLTLLQDPNQDITARPISQEDGDLRNGRIHLRMLEGCPKSRVRNVEYRTESDWFRILLVFFDGDGTGVLDDSGSGHVN